MAYQRGMSWDIRIGREFTAEELEPLEYATPAGLVVARLVRGATRDALNDLAATYTIDGVLWSAYEVPLESRKDTATKEGAEVFGAVRAFAIAGVSTVAIHTGFTPPHPDLAVRVDGLDAALEVTQVRPEADFTAAQRELAVFLKERVDRDPALKAIAIKKRISFGMVAMPRRRDLAALADEIVSRIKAHDWTSRDLLDPRSDPLGSYVGHVETFSGPNPEADIRIAWLVSTRAIPDQAPMIVDAIERKNTKTYNVRPLWLAITAVTPSFEPLQRVRLERVDPGQFDRVYITDGQDALTISRV